MTAFGWYVVGCCASAWAGWFAGRRLRQGRLDAAWHEGWTAGHAEGHRRTMADIQTGADVNKARHDGWMEGFKSAAAISLASFDEPR